MFMKINNAMTMKIMLIANSGENNFNENVKEIIQQ